MGANQKAFWALLKVGLWERLVHDSSTSEAGEPSALLMGHDYLDVDWEKVYQLATEQSVLGIMLVGIERLKSFWTSQAAKRKRSRCSRGSGAGQVDAAAVDW